MVATTMIINMVQGTIATDQNDLLWSISQTANAFNFSVEFFIFISLLLYECRNGGFKGKLSDILEGSKVLTVLCPLFSMLNLLTMEVMIIADKFLIQHQYGDIICRAIYNIRPFTYSLALLTPYIFLWYHVLNLYKRESFLVMNTCSVKALKVVVPCVSVLCAVVGCVVYVMEDVHRMTAIGCLNDKGNSLDRFLYFGSITAQIFCLVALTGLMHYPLLSHRGAFSEEEDVTRQLVRKTTNVSIVSLAVAVSVDLAVCVIMWFYPANWKVLPLYVLFDFSVLVKNLSMLFFFQKPFEMLFSLWKRSDVIESV